MPQDISKNIFSIKTEAYNILSEISSASISIEQIEASANKLGEFGDKALQFVARYLNKENSDEALTRLLYLIELLNDSSYTSVLKDVISSGRFRDSSVKTRVEIIATLKSYEIIPFYSSGSFSDKDGEDAFIIWVRRVLEDFQSREYRAISLLEEILLGEGVRKQLIIKISTALSTTAVPFLSILAGSDTKEAASLAIKCLSRIKDEEAVFALKELIATSWNRELISEAEKALRRLRFSGFNTANINFLPKMCLPEGSKLYASPIDGLGNINLCIAINKGSSRFETTFLLSNDETGIIDAFGSSNMKANELFEMLAETGKETAIKEVPAAYFFDILNNALHLNEKYDLSLSPEFHYRKQSFKQFLKSKPYSPNADPSSMQGNKLENGGAKLFKRDEFEGWIISTPTSFDFAEKLVALEAGNKCLLGIKKNKLLNDFCIEIITPIKKQLSSRLLMMADFFCQTHEDKETTDIILATAFHLRECDSPLLGESPFLKAMAEKSMRHCIEALNDGFDLRDFEDEFDEFD